MRATHQERDDDSERNEISCGKLEGRETSLEQTERKEKVRDKMSEIEVLDRPHDQEERSTIPGEEEDNQAINRRGGCGNDLMVVDMAEREQSNTQQQESKAESRSRTNSPLMKRVSSELHLNAMIISNNSNSASGSNDTRQKELGTLRVVRMHSFRSTRSKWEQKQSEMASTSPPLLSPKGPSTVITLPNGAVVSLTTSRSSPPS